MNTSEKYSVEFAQFDEEINDFFLKENWDLDSTSADLLKIFRPSCFYRSKSSDLNVIAIQKIINFSKKFIVGKNSDFDTFKLKLKSYDFSVTCGFSWLESDFGYRCRTCCQSPYIAWCVPCFNNSNHSGHDFVKFKCYAGGTCDCGNADAMPESGYCCNHGPSVLTKQQKPPEDLIRRFKMLIPIYLKCFLFSSWSLIESFNLDEMLELTPDGRSDFSGIVSLAMSFISDLLLCCGMVKEIIGDILIDKGFYIDFIQDMKDADLYSLYNREILPQEDLQYFETIGPQLLDHETMLDVFMFLCVRFRFHDNIISFLIGLLTNDSYKKVFISSFIDHYSRIASYTLQESQLQRYTQDDLMNTIVRISDVSVQFIIFEVIALKMVKEKKLHYIVLYCISYMLEPSFMEILMPDIIVLDCERAVIQQHVCLSFLSDWLKLLSHKSVIDYILTDHHFMIHWTTLLSCMQFMDFAVQKEGDYIRENSMTCYGAMNLELVFSVKPMWKVWSNYHSTENQEKVLKLVEYFVDSLAQYLSNFNVLDDLVVYVRCRKLLSFHLPLIRNVTCFISLALFHHDLPIDVVLRDLSLKDMIVWFKEMSNVLMGNQEILVGYWVRNGDSLKTSRHFYGYNVYCYGFIDMDILAAQLCASVMPSSEVMYILTDPSQLLRGIQFAVHRQNDEELTSTKNRPSGSVADIEKHSLALESWLMALCWLLDLRNEMDIDEKAKLRKEICCKLCLEPIRHSNLNDRLPDRTGLHQSIDLDELLNEVANFTGPTFDEYSGVLLSGLYTFKCELWDSDYDPVFQSLRSETKQDAVKALGKYREYYRQKQNIAQPNSLWPPYRKPPPPHDKLWRLENVLHCKDLTYILFCSLQMFLNGDPLVSEDSLAIVVHLIHRALVIDESSKFQKDDDRCTYETRFPDNPYKVDDVRTNVRYNVDIQGDTQNNESTSVVVQWESILSLLLKIHSKLHADRLRMGGKPLLVMKAPRLLKSYPKTGGKLPNLYSDLNINNRDFKENHSTTMSLDFYVKYPLVYYYSRGNLKIAEETGLGINWGDGVDVIGHLLDIISSSNDDNSKYLLELAGNIYSMDTDEVNSDCDSINSKDDLSGSQSDLGEVRILDSFRARKEKANDRRKKLMSNMLLKQKTFATTYQHQISDSAASADSSACHVCVICQHVTASREQRIVLLGMVCSAELPMSMQCRHKGQNSPITANDGRGDENILNNNSPYQSRGIIIQTCGHVVHQECFDKYKKHKQSTIDSEEWVSCPMCRREVHYLLPINTKDFLPTSEEPFYSNLKFRLLKSLDAAPCDMRTNFLFTSHISKKIANINIEHQACSLLRSQLELELIVCLSAPDQYSTVTKRCHWPQFISYLRTLNANIMTLIRQSDWLLGTSIYHGDDDESISLCRPFLFETPSDMFLDFIPYVWPHEDEVRCILDACIVMAYVKSLVVIGSKLNLSQYDHWYDESPDADEIGKQFHLILMRLKTLGYIPFIIDHPRYLVTRDTIVNELMKSLLPLLRIAVILKLRLLKVKDIPKNCPLTEAGDVEILDVSAHFIQLCEYLSLTQTKYSSQQCSGLLTTLLSNCMKSTLYGTLDDIVNVYVDEEFIILYMKEYQDTEICEPNLYVLNIGNELCPPRLIQLPETYEELFNQHHSVPCLLDQHGQNIQRNGLCLICGESICLFCQSLSKSFYEHSVSCCLGLGVIIDVNSSIVLVLVNDEVSQWGSVYLDHYGEEDLELKRGRPLFINDARLKLLTQQWITLSFKHVLKSWQRI